MNVTKVIIFIILGFIVFVVGGGAGVMYQQQKELPAPQAQESNSLLAKITSKTISVITVSGQVTKIDGRNVTLTFGGDDLTVKIGDDAKINSVVPPSPGKEPVFKKAEFKDIKKGDSLDVHIRFLPDGQIEGYAALLILPVAK